MGWSIVLRILARIWPYLVVLLLVGGVFTYWHHLTGQVAKLQEEVKTVTAERDQWKSNYDGLKTGLEAQKKILDQLTKATNVLQQNMNKLRNDVATKTNHLQQSLTEINKQNLSKLTDKEAIEYLRQRAGKQ